MDELSWPFEEICINYLWIKELSNSKFNKGVALAVAARLYIKLRR